MLPGGVKVVGIYLWASETAVKNSTLLLCQVLLSRYHPLQHVAFNCISYCISIPDSSNIHLLSVVD